MKSKFSLTIALLLVTTLFVSAARADYTKNIKKGWPKNAVSALKVTNKFGEIKINDLGGDSVTIQVIITVENPSESKARDLINKISIDFDKSGGQVIAETRIEEDFRSKQSFTIDYVINIPKDRELDITNRYGNVIIKELEAKGTINVSYGNLNAGRLKVPSGSPAIVNMSYGKADIESINDATMVFKYSKLYGGTITHLNMDSKYSEVNLQRINNLRMDSKYDAINIEEIGNLKAGSRYTNYKIGLLHENFDLDTGYGSVRIDKVDSKFSNIRIINSYGGINIGLNDLSYQLKADCSYCNVDFPSDRYKGNRIRDNQNFSVDGNVGNGGGKVTISSRYGGVKLTN